MFFGGGDPFEHFANMHGSSGGGGGGGGGGRGRGGPGSDTQKLYDVLGVKKDDDEATIRKAYKKLALKNHPDKGGDSDKFKEISAAAEILGDPEKRKIYDQHGLDGFEGGGGGGDADDIFSMFFGGGRGKGGSRGPRKGEDIAHSIKASLEDMYNGKTVRLAISRNKPCQDCEGRGGKEGAEKTCSDCNGRGVKVSLRQIGPGMVQQVQSHCNVCKGQGKRMDERDKCKSCKGTKVYKDRKVLEVNIEKGMVNGQKIKFAGEADEVPGTYPGDVVIQLQEKPHDLFKRNGADIVTEFELSLSEALCGFTKTIKHLDGRVLKIESAAGEVMKHDAVTRIRGEGMPQHGNIFNKGDLYIHFKVKFPRTIDSAAVAALRKILPSTEGPMLTGEEEECTMDPVDLSQFGKGAGGGRSAHAADEDDEEGQGGAQRVQCGQQ